MKNNSNQDGLTLIEILAVMVLLSIITSSIFGLLISGNKNFERQSDNNSQLNELTFVLKQVTKDVRQSSTVQISSNILTLDSTTYLYNVNTQSLERNGQVLSTSIKQFQVLQNNNQLFIAITGIFGKTVQTTVVLRSGE